MTSATLVRADQGRAAMEDRYQVNDSSKRFQEGSVNLIDPVSYLLRIERIAANVVHLDGRAAWV